MTEYSVSVLHEGDQFDKRFTATIYRGPIPGEIKKHPKLVASFSGPGAVQQAATWLDGQNADVLEWVS